MASPQFTPTLQLQTLFLLREDGRILSTREPNPSHGPTFALVRGPTECACAVHADMPDEPAGRLLALSREEPPTAEFQSAPLHAQRYIALAGETVNAGPAFLFPDPVTTHADIATVTESSQLEKHFRGWTDDDIPGCGPILAVLQDGHAVSVCFSARRSAVAAEAGLETAAGFRGQGLGPRVTAAWAAATRGAGRLPLYSTSWTNHASLAVARKLRLALCASDWTLSR